MKEKKTLKSDAKRTRNNKIFKDRNEKTGC